MLAVSPGSHTSRQRHLKLQETSTMAATATATSSAATAVPVSPHLVSGHVHVEPFPPSSSSLSSSASHPQLIQIHDRCHGDVNLTEPLLVELLLSAPVQRLKHIQQHGITSLIGMTPSPVITRYEHSVGAMLLVRQAGGSVEAQAAALLHDIAHTALSHVVDGAFGYVVHEDDKMEYLHTTTIPAILQKHGLDPEHTLEEVNFPLLELDAPAICADRLDYGIRDSLSFGFLTEHAARSISADLAAGPEGRFCFKSQQWAAVHSYAYMKSDEYAWSNPTHSLLYQRAADAIRVAHKSGHMEKAELWQKADEAFWRSMTQSANAEVRRLALAVRPSVRVSQISAEEYEATDSKEAFYKERAKIRTVDPDVLQPDGSVRRLTEIDSAYKAAREAYIARKSGPKYFAVTEA